MSRTRNDDRDGRIAVKLAFIAALVLALAASVATAGTVLYVDDDAPLGGNGQAWETAYRYLQDGLAAAQPGSGVEEIRVGQGMYKPDQDEGGGVTPGDREASFELIDGIAIVGGYAGVGAPDPDERDIVLYETILSGDLNGDDQEPYENMGDNSGHVLKGFGLGGTARLDGIIVARGFAEEDEIETSWAAGLWLEDSDLLIVQCTFRGNRSEGNAGGVGIYNGSPRLENCRFETNLSLESGGGLAAYSDRPLTLTGCTFEGNRSDQGGGANVQAPAVIIGCTFIENEAFHGHFGGLALIQEYAFVLDCQFTDNHCPYYGAGLGCAYEGQRTVMDCVFSGNQADQGGGGLACDDGTEVRVFNCLFEGNTSSEFGGGVWIKSDAAVQILCSDYIANSSRAAGAIFTYDGLGVSLTDCRFLGNQAEQWAGAVYHGFGAGGLTLTNCLFSGNVAEVSGAIICSDGQLYIRNCTIANNSASDVAGGIRIAGGTVEVVDCVVWGNSDSTGITESAQITLGANGMADVSSSCIQELDSFAGPGNIGDDPQFLDPDGEDEIFGTIDDDLHLQPGSPCIDAGDNAVVGLCVLDLDSRIRRADDPNTPDTGFGEPPIVDMGVFEVESSAGPDCNSNALDDDCEISEGMAEDCNENDIPDDCDIAYGASADCNYNGIPDECEVDCNNNSVADECDIRDGYSEDCNENDNPDECDIADGISEDCNENGVPDECDLVGGYSEDCNENEVPDECDISGGVSEDCNDNGVPDECELTLRRAGVLLADDGEHGDRLGYSVAVSGNIAVGGAKYDDDNGEWSGSAYAFVREGTDWLQEAKLLPSDGEEFEYFGCSVDVSGDTAVIGAYYDQDNGIQSGSAYVFIRRYGGEWVQLTKLLADDGFPYDYFGTSVAIDGGRIMVGAPGEDDAGPKSGAAYVFVRNGFDWIQEAKLYADDADMAEQFGCSVALDGDTAVIGAERDDDNGSSSGSAYVFVFDGSDWGQQAKLLPDDGAANDYFGRRVSVSGDTAVVGAEEDDDNGAESGSAYVFVRSGLDWVQQAKLLADDGASGDRFGGGCTVEGYTILIGAPYDKHYYDDFGSAYVFIREGAAWVQEAAFGPDYSPDHIMFGYSVDISGPIAVVGAIWDRSGVYDAGSIYVFSADMPDCNFNSVPDECDIADGISDDRNNNGVPDECECFADLDGDGKVNIDDLFQILGAWGGCDGCPEDLNGDGKVNIDDLFMVLNEWGPCE